MTNDAECFSVFLFFVFVTVLAYIDKNSLREEGLVWQLEEQPVMWEVTIAAAGAAGHIALTVKKQRDECTCSTNALLCV